MKSDSRGNTAVIIVVILVLAIVGSTGFYLLKKNGKVLTSATKTVVSSVETQKAFDDCKKEFSDDDLCKALSNFIGTKQYQTTMTTTSGGSSLTYTLEIDGDKTYTKQNFSGKSLETIHIGNTTYTKDNNDGKWWKQVFETTKSNTTDDLKFDTNISSTDTKTTYTKVGEEACDKLTCVKYKVVDAGSKDTQYIWIDKKDHLMRKWSTESSDGAKTDAIYSYNKKSVDAPNSTKDASPTQSVIPADFYSGMNFGNSNGGSSSQTNDDNTSTSTSVDSSNSSETGNDSPEDTDQ
jgi:outer membrane lipoprotein-sorting protein